MTARGELFVTEVLRDEVEQRAKALGIEIPAGLYLKAAPFPEINELLPGFRGTAYIYDAEQDDERCGVVAYELRLNPGYTGELYEELTVISDLFVVLFTTE